MFSLALVGSREFTNFELFKSWVDYVIENLRINTEGLEIVSGGARGTDTLARQYAELYDYPFKEFKADWSIGKQAGYIRNAEVIEYSDAVAAVIFGPDIHPCKGTRHTIGLAKSKGMPLRVMIV